MVTIAITAVLLVATADSTADSTVVSVAAEKTDISGDKGSSVTKVAVR